MLQQVPVQSFDPWTSPGPVYARVRMGWFWLFRNVLPQVASGWPSRKPNNCECQEWALDPKVASVFLLVSLQASLERYQVSHKPKKPNRREIRGAQVCMYMCSLFSQVSSRQLESPEVPSSGFVAAFSICLVGFPITRFWIHSSFFRFYGWLPKPRMVIPAKCGSHSLPIGSPTNIPGFHGLPEAKGMGTLWCFQEAKAARFS